MLLVLLHRRYPGIVMWRPTEKCPEVVPLLEARSRTIWSVGLKKRAANFKPALPQRHIQDESVAVGVTHLEQAIAAMLSSRSYTIQNVVEKAA